MIKKDIQRQKKERAMEKQRGKREWIKYVEIRGSHVSLKAPDYFLGSHQRGVGSYGASAIRMYLIPVLRSNTRRVDISKMKDSRN